MFKLDSIMNRVLNLELGRKTWIWTLPYVLNMWPWASQWISLCLSFFFYKIGIIIVLTPKHCYVAQMRYLPTPQRAILMIALIKLVPLTIVLKATSFHSSPTCNSKWGREITNVSCSKVLEVSLSVFVNPTFLSSHWWIKMNC